MIGQVLIQYMTDMFFRYVAYSVIDYYDHFVEVSPTQPYVLLRYLFADECMLISGTVHSSQNSKVVPTIPGVDLRAAALVTSAPTLQTFSTGT